MMGKLHVWRGDHRNGHERIRGSGLGGLVSIEDLEAKKTSPSPSKSIGKKAARLAIGRRSFSRRPSQSKDEPFLAHNPLVAEGITLFSNIPAQSPLANGTAIERSPSSNRSLRTTPTSPSTPSTASPETMFGRHQAKTASVEPPQTPSPLSARADKPLPSPLAVKLEHRRKRSLPNQVSTLNDKAAFGASLARPSTATGSERPQQAATVGHKPTAVYTLTPAISPNVSRRTSVCLPESRRGSRARSNSNTSVNAAALRSSSQRSGNAQTSPSVATPSDVRLSSNQVAILDDVEGSLSATITELQELQSPWYFPQTAHERAAAEPKSPNGASPSQGYFVPRHSAQYAPDKGYSGSDQSRSLPPTPLGTLASRDESRSLAWMQSNQAAYEQQKRISAMLAAENESLKKQISVAQTKLADVETIRLERDQLECSFQEVQTNIDSVLDRVRIARNNEQAAQNIAVALAARLEEANLQKIDVLEHDHELEQQIRRMEREMGHLRQEVLALQDRPEQATLDKSGMEIREAEEKAKLQKEIESIDGRTDLPSVVADLAFKLEDMERTLREKDVHIDNLLKVNKSQDVLMEELEAHRIITSETKTALKLLKASHENIRTKREASIAKVREMEQTLSEQERDIRTTQIERDHFRQLLYAELRRAANEVHNRQHPATALLERKLDLDAAINDVRTKAQQYIAKQTVYRADVDRARHREDLEKEVEYHVKDIVLYKLDVKGYKKDLKRAQAKIQQLTLRNSANSDNSSSTHGLSNSTSSAEGRPARRPSLISQPSLSKTTVPQLNTGNIGESNMMRRVPSTTDRPPPMARLSLQNLTPSGSSNGSPVITPRKEKGVVLA